MKDEEGVLRNRLETGTMVIEQFSPQALKTGCHEDSADELSPAS